MWHIRCFNTGIAMVEFINEHYAPREENGFDVVKIQYEKGIWILIYKEG